MLTTALKLLSTDLAKRLLVALAEILAKRTDNKLDDEIVAGIKKALDA